jgi:hypothetical protein
LNEAIEISSGWKLHFYYLIAVAIVVVVVREKPLRELPQLNINKITHEFQFTTTHSGRSHSQFSNEIILCIKSMEACHIIQTKSKLCSRPVYKTHTFIYRK